MPCRFCAHDEVPVFRVGGGVVDTRQMRVVEQREYLYFAVEGIGCLDRFLRWQSAQVNLFDGDNVIGDLYIKRLIDHPEAARTNYGYRLVAPMQQLLLELTSRLLAGKAELRLLIIGRAAVRTVPGCFMHVFAALSRRLRNLGSEYDQPPVVAVASPHAAAGNQVEMMAAGGTKNRVDCFLPRSIYGIAHNLVYLKMQN